MVPASERGHLFATENGADDMTTNFQGNWIDTLAPVDTLLVDSDIVLRELQPASELGKTGHYGSVQGLDLFPAVHELTSANAT